VSTTTSPVTLIADVAVNNAFKKPIDLPLRDAKGRFNKSDPNNTISIELKIRILVGESLFV
jgi:hypothetical protein